VRVRSKFPFKGQKGKSVSGRSKLERSLIVCLLPIEEDSRFFRRYEVETDRVSDRFDVIKNYLLQMINIGKHTIYIRETKPIPSGQVHIIEKYTFDKFEWHCSYKLPVTISGRHYSLQFEIPNSLPDEKQYETIPVIEKRAYRLPLKLVKK